jgi:hypothetical protein
LVKLNFILKLYQVIDDKNKYREFFDFYLNNFNYFEFNELKDFVIFIKQKIESKGGRNKI